MKIAIVGAGIAGTTCAEELYKLGHEVEIFEMSAPDETTRPRQMEGSANFLDNIPEIETEHRMKRVDIHSPNINASLKGKLGFFYEIGGKDSIEIKAQRRVEKLLPIHYSTKIEKTNQLKDRFPIIVAADGYRSRIAKGAGLLVSNTPKQIGVGAGLTIKGEFDPEGMEIWFDNQFSFRGYSYVIPFSGQEASLVSASVGRKINTATYNRRLKELCKVRKWETLNEWADFECWYDFKTYAQNNLYLIGNAASFTETAFGFGLKWAVKSAKLCAKAIHTNADYNQLIQKEINPDFTPFQIMRKFFEKAENKDHDQFVKSFKNILVRRVAASGKSLLKIYVKMKMFKT